MFSSTINRKFNSAIHSSIKGKAGDIESGDRGDDLGSKAKPDSNVIAEPDSLRGQLDTVLGCNRGSNYHICLDVANSALKDLRWRYIIAQGLLYEKAGRVAQPYLMNQDAN
ncbi:hypothetical protein GOP47_0028474 [Adiantum capillus-veneris]|nr:hypothetical protein GOP47_0028474 [Adiantum capillus-veneris]